MKLAWCSYLTKEQFQEALQNYSHVEKEILQFTRREGDYYITAYTRVLAEQYRIYDAVLPDGGAGYSMGGTFSKIKTTFPSALRLSIRSQNYTACGRNAQCNKN